MEKGLQPVEKASVLRTGMYDGAGCQVWEWTVAGVMLRDVRSRWRGDVGYQTCLGPKAANLSYERLITA
jgi:hypothetical protein